MLAALEDVRQQGPLPVPLHLRNAPTKLMKGLGYGKDYQYAHDHEGAVVTQQHLPDELRDRRYYRPSERGHERAIKERLEQAAERRATASKPAVSPEKKA